MDALSKKTGKDVYVSTEVGQNQLWSVNYFNVKRPESFITSGGFGTMGYGLPAAIGAIVSNETKTNGIKGGRTVLVTGDGSIQMNIQEFQTFLR